jgi:hypothetical protein
LAPRQEAGTSVVLPPGIGAASRVDTAALVRTGTQTQPGIARTREPDGIASGSAASQTYEASFSAAATTSNNWSGYVVGPGPYTGVTGTFNVPNLAAAPIETFTAEWVGIDGSSNGSLIQAGVTEVYDPSTNLVYTSAAWGGGAWWEILPAPWTPITSMAVKPGDSVTVTISQVTATLWEITLTDNTTGHSFTINQTYTGPLTSAEWIVEAPSSARGIQETLGEYSPAVTFSGLRMTGPETTSTPVTMVQGGVTVSVPSALTTAGFSVAYVAAHAPTPSPRPAPVPTAALTPPPTFTPTPTGLAQARAVLVNPSELNSGFVPSDHDYTFAEKAAATSNPPTPYRTWAEALTAWGWQLGSYRDLVNASTPAGVFEVTSLANVYSSISGAASAYASNLTNLAATTGTPYSTSPLGTGIGDQSAAFTRLITLPTTAGGQLAATELVIYVRAGRVSNVVTLFSYPNQMDTALAVRLARQQAIRTASFNPNITPAPTSTPLPIPTVAPGGNCTPSTGPGIPGPHGLATGIDGWHAAWYGQSGYPTLCPGQQSTATVAFLNTGTNGWVLGRAGQTAYLGTSGPEPGQDQPSPLGGDGTSGSPNTGWPVFNRVAVQPAGYVGPGQVAWFQFAIRAPSTPGTYRLALRPLIEGTNWLEDYGVFWYVTVVSATGAPTPTPVPTLPPAATPTPPPTAAPTPIPTRIGGATVTTRQTSFSPQEGVTVDWTNPSPAVGDYVTFARQDNGSYYWIWTLEPSTVGEVTLRPAGLAPGIYQLRLYSVANVLLATGPYVTVQ